MKYIFLVLFSIAAFASAPEKPAYRIFDKKGKEVSYEEMMKACAKTELVLFGEYHDNPIVHWLQFQVMKDLHKEVGDNLMPGAEMFEADNQLLINEYMVGAISQKSFESEARLWPNYKTDYKPMLEFARENNLGFVATNIPRRYASSVFHKGIKSLDGLSDEAKRYIAPLPIEVDFELPAYAELVEMGGENFTNAQAVKDATMGHFIAKHLQEDRVFLHLNGSFHSDNFEGIHWYVEKYRPGTKRVSIATVSQSDISSLEEGNKGKGDFTILVPEDMTKTH